MQFQPEPEANNQARNLVPVASMSVHPTLTGGAAAIVVNRDLNDGTYPIGRINLTVAQARQLATELRNIALRSAHEESMWK